MSLKVIFSDAQPYAPISAQTWNTIVSADTLFSGNVVFQNFDDAAGNYPNAQTIPVVITQLGNNYCSIEIRVGDLTPLQFEPMTATRVYSYRSADPLPVNCFNPNNNVQLGVCAGGVFDNSANVLLLRPCDYCFAIDTLGYLYYTICYTSGTGATNQWSSGFLQNQRFIPSCQSSGSSVVNTSYANDTLLLSNATFIYPLN